MKLTDLQPTFVGAGGPNVTTAAGQPVPERDGVGLSFNCPCGCDHRGFVYFENPLDGKPGCGGGAPEWRREGETFETLTLTPSIQRKQWTDRGGKKHGCDWHGYITAGEIVNC